MFVACCHVVMAALRYRQQAVRRALPVIGQALRQLLKALVVSGGSIAPRQALGRVLPAKSIAELMALRRPNVPDAGLMMPVCLTLKSGLWQPESLTHFDAASRKPCPVVL